MPTKRRYSPKELKIQPGPLSDSSLVRRSQGASVMREVNCVLDYLDERV